MKKNGLYLILTAVISTLVLLGFVLWLCWMGERHPELTQQRCEYDNFQSYGYCFINTIQPHCGYYEAKEDCLRVDGEVRVDEGALYK